MKSEEWLRRDKAALAGVLPRCSDIVASFGRGSWITDVDGNNYLDFASGIAACSTGHCHPKVVEAINKQAGTLIHTSVVTHNTVNIELAEKLCSPTITPFFDRPQVFFTNSGAEAVDGSLKLARMASGRSGVIAFTGGFHGRTVAATALTTAKQKYRTGYTPHLPYVYHCPYGENLDAVIGTIRGNSRNYQIGAMIVEPVLGEGGYVVPPLEWLQGLRRICNMHGIVLIFDEVQTGIGRTGKPFAAETFGVKPDILLFSKGIASGLPLGGIIAEKVLMDKWPEGTHGSTFGGNPVSCAAALATLDILDPLYARVRSRGQWILEQLTNSGPVECNVRGVGYMIGIELKDSETAKQVQAQCLTRGLIILLCGPDDRVIRLIPPLTVTDAEIELGLSILEGALTHAWNSIF